MLISAVSVLHCFPAIADTPDSHDKWQTLPKDHLLEFEASITSFCRDTYYDD
jgi:hypothetical protein